MKFTGRIVLLCTAIVFSLLSAFFFKEPIKEQIFEAFVAGVIAWLAGKQYDKAKFYNKELEQTKEELKQQKEELYSLFDNGGSFIWSNDLVNRKITVSKGVEKLFGYTTKDFEENYDLWLSLSCPDDKERVTEYYNELLSGIPAQCEWRAIRRNGEMRWVEARGTPIFSHSGEIIKLNGAVYDITERKKQEELLHYLAFYDYLTGLPNRYMLKKHFQKALARCKPNKKEIAVLFIDLDRFKFINDSKGHEAGDMLLKEITKRLLQMVRDGDVVVRQGGDEFIILLEDINKAQVKEIAERIIHSFKKPFILTNEELFSSPSIGISLYPQDGQDSETLIKNADTAMYWAKKRGKNNYQFFVREPEGISERKLQLEYGLRKALDDDEFMLYYQPQVELDTGRWQGFEALIRWNHPEFGVVSPAEFIPIAEDSGLIVPIGKWAIDTACKQNKLWQKQGLSQIKIAVNVSAIQFEDRNFVHMVKSVLDKHQLAPELLELEITESVMKNVNETAITLRQLKEIGVTISIDDFGTGYSSLGILNQLPIDIIKIDKSFVNEIATNSDAATLVKAMIDMGTNLNFGIIAEGIEQQQQADILYQKGCHFGQGYFYSAPLPVDSIETWMERYAAFK